MSELDYTTVAILIPPPLQLGQGLENENLLLHLITQANILKLQNTLDQFIGKENNTTGALEELNSRFKEN